MDGWTVSWVGDSALVAAGPPRIDPGLSDRVLRLGAELRRAAPAGVREVVEGYHTVTVHVDPLLTDREALVGELQRAAARLEASPADVDDAGEDGREVVVIPVCYGNRYGADLEDVARQVGMSPDEVVRRHAAPTYRVYLLGFLPGFPYLGLLPPEIAVPRRAAPRLAVPAGSVGLAGRQTGIYPMTAPGGWQLIGRTPHRPFDAHRADPFLLRAGDRVRFDPVSETVFDELSAWV